jgi:cbb3-type cytochrome oxidase subunit 3
MLKKFWDEFLEFFSDAEDPEEPIYDPAHIAALIVFMTCALGAMFWLFWTLLVFGGGLFRKIGPAAQVAFTSKTLKDFGWVGYPYEMGIFEGAFANLAALALLVGFICGIWWVFNAPRRPGPSQEE